MWAAVLLTMLVLAGCGGARAVTGRSRPASAGAAKDRPRQATVARSGRPATAVPQPRRRCGTPNEPALTLRFPAADGVRLDGAIVGRGKVAAILLEEYPGPLCGWWPYAVYLAHHGVRALLFDFRCLGASTCPTGGKANPVSDVAGAIAVLRARGARSIALVGASLGGVVAVIAGAALHPAAIVDLSGERDLTGLLPGVPLDSYVAARRVRVPALFAVARADRYVSVGDMRAVYRRARSSAKQLIVEPAAAGHGWDMLVGSDFTWSPLARQVLAFITSHSS